MVVHEAYLSRRIVWRVAGIMAAAALAGAFGCKRGAPPAVMDRPPAPVVVSTAVSRDVPVYLDEIGKTAAFEMVTVMPQLAGRIDQLHFVDGSELKQGQLLFTIDPRPFKASLDQAQAMLAKDQATAGNAERYAQRQADIFKQKIISPSDYDTARFAAESAAAAVQADQAAVAQANLNLEYCYIKSPINGRAGQRLVDPGNVVKINETPLLVIQRLDPIYADFTINERDLTAVRRDMASHTLHAFIKEPGDSDEGREGELTFLDNAVADASGTIKLRATLANKDRRFWPGQFVNVRLVLRTIKDAVLVPSGATQTSQQGDYVYVIGAGDTAEQRSVVLGQRQGESIVVQTGMKAGETVIVDGQILVMPGSKVHIVSNAAETQPSPTTQPSTGPVAGPATQPVTLNNSSADWTGGPAGTQLKSAAGAALMKRSSANNVALRANGSVEGAR
ncbi:MAG TPA: efflux RND transporter periplasmic adaptor subunit [Tepidisphaeraceae bacterium]|nr:efflux RND transporter periplasmic adaptor subunit [Tepidisphaeraceae bacterium]